MLAGTVIVGLFQKVPPKEFIHSVLNVLSIPQNYQLVLAVAIISIMAKLLQKNSILENMVTSLSQLVGNLKITIVILPALVGAIPFTGGAIISAPLVNTVGEQLRISPKLRCTINLYFRHGWYFIAPYRPALILAAGLASIELGELIRIQAPLVIFSFLIGYWFLLEGVDGNNRNENIDTMNRWQLTKRFLWLSSPLTIPFLLFISIKNISTVMAFIPGLIIAIFISRKGLKLTKFYKYVNWSLIASTGAIIVFSATIRQMPGLSSLMGYIANTGIPLILVVLLLPMLAGFSLGNGVAAIGITFPLLMEVLPVGPERLGYIMLMSVGVFSGYFASPIHLCQLLTNEYFKVQLMDVYKEYAFPLLALIIFSIIWFFCYIKIIVPLTF